jgi:NAD(P)-dependent dehydrogenase (short-subunit alcohol dehydrogenase family)
MKVAVVTGSTSGIGKKTVELLLEKNISVIGLARDQKKADEVYLEFKHLLKDQSLDFVIGNLETLKETKQSALNIHQIIDKKYDGKFDLLFHVAGLVSSKYTENADGNELTFAVNHLSVFYLTYHLVSRMLKSDDPRMLVVSSKSHYRANINWDNIQSKKFYNILKAYKRSKTYNILFVKGIAEKFPEIKTYAIDPGLVNTNLGLKNTGFLAYHVWNNRRKKGTDTLYPTRFMIDVALKKGYLDHSGLYIKEGVVVKSNPITYLKKNIIQMWLYSESLTNTTFNHENYYKY